MKEFTIEELRKLRPIQRIRPLQWETDDNEDLVAYRAIFRFEIKFASRYSGRGPVKAFVNIRHTKAADGSLRQEFLTGATMTSQNYEGEQEAKEWCQLYLLYVAHKLEDMAPLAKHALNPAQHFLQPLLEEACNEKPAQGDDSLAASFEAGVRSAFLELNKLTIRHFVKPLVWSGDADVMTAEAGDRQYRVTPFSAYAYTRKYRGWHLLFENFEQAGMSAMQQWCQDAHANYIEQLAEGSVL